MIKVEKAAATGFLSEILSNLDERELLRTENRMLIAVKISKALKQKKISQKQFAGKMGKSTTVISEWLSGDRNFTIDTLTDIGDMLGIKLLDTELAPALTITSNYSKDEVKTIKMFPVKTSGHLSYDGPIYIDNVLDKHKAG
jgi:transcriptional regulator with XRE-family HTH domain